LVTASLVISASAMPVIYIVRHAHAVTEEENPLRPLSTRGHDECRRLVAFLQNNRAFTPAEIWHSPLARARETAERLRPLVPLAALRETLGLLPEDKPEKMAARIATLAPTLILAIIGHEPHLSALATLLVTGRSGHAAFALEKGAILCLASSDNHTWSVRWHIAPPILPA
jgi:phosphohistidine phosphatase